MPTMPGMASFQGGGGGYQRAEQGEASTFFAKYERILDTDDRLEYARWIE